MSEYITKIRTDQGDKQIDYNALANLPTISNPNLLINSDFRNPINQRGQTSYTGGGIYSIDRWMLGNSATLTVQDGSIKFEQSSGATNTGRLVYKFENALPTNYYTISVKVLSCNGGASMDDFGTIADGFTGVFTATTTSEKELSTFRFYIAAGRSIEIEWIKLEQGTVATPFVPRLYAEEFIMCQRYYQRFQKLPIYTASSDGLTYRGLVYNIPMRTGIIVNVTGLYNSSGAEVATSTVTSTSINVYNFSNMVLSSSLGQYGYVSYTLDAEIY